MKEDLNNQINICRDLITFITYISDRDVKRSHRDNLIPKADLKRLTKILDVPETRKDSELEEGSWAEWISFIALNMGLISYDIEGSYATYSSCTTSYPENYIEINEQNCKKFFSLTPAEKEMSILKTLLEKNKNEFHYSSILGTIGRFSTTGSAINAASKMNLEHIRKELLEILSGYEIDKPIPFETFLQDVRKQHPHLILKKYDKSKYYCFYENLYPKKRTDDEHSWNNGDKQIEVNESDPDAFMRVEGRYLAYFLEQIPNVMQLVTLKFDQDYIQGQHDKHPMLPHFIKSFSVTKKLKAMVKKDLSYLNYVKTTVTPDFKIFIESTLYPDNELEALKPHTNVISRHQYMTTLELDRKKSIQSLANNPSAKNTLDVLKDLGVIIPKNVATDVSEWSTQADKFVVYNNVGLLEIDKESPDIRKLFLKDFNHHIVDHENSEFVIVNNFEQLYQILEQTEMIPVKIRHNKNRIRTEKLKFASSKPKNHFAKQVKGNSISIEKVALEESHFIALKSKNQDFIRKLSKAFQDKGIEPVHYDEKAGICFIPNTARSKLNPVIKILRKKFEIEIA